MKRRRRGYTLIECMIAVAIFGITSSIFMSAFQDYQNATDRQYKVEGLARVLDVEMERARACTDAACLRAFAAERAPSKAADTWVRAELKRKVGAGPDGTFEVAISARAEGLPEQTLTGLVWVKR